MADVVVWPVEDIPGDAKIYMRAHRMYFRPKLQPGVFRPHDGGMSVDWEKYSTPEETRQRAAKPEDNAVICLPVEGVRAIDRLDVKHTPDHTLGSENRAHSDVLGIPDGGEDQTEIRALLLEISKVVIGP